MIVKPALERESGSEVDEVDVRAAGHVVLSQHVPAEVVLAHE